MDALACGCTVLGSDTPPVREVIEHERNGLLAGFNDVDGLVRQALRVLADPEGFRRLGQEGTRLVDARYSIDVTMPETVAFYREVAERANDPRRSNRT
jgi:glycosyltransferase involved in cell wall biosynthesis